MTNLELAGFRKLLVAKLAELARAVQNREGIEIERNADALDEVQGAAERNSSSAIWIASHGSCATCEEPLRASTIAPGAFACVVKKTSTRSGSMPCPGPRTAFLARNGPIGRVTAKTNTCCSRTSRFWFSSSQNLESGGLVNRGVVGPCDKHCDGVSACSWGDRHHARA